MRALIFIMFLCMDANAEAKLVKLPAITLHGVIACEEKTEIKDPFTGRSMYHCPDLNLLTLTRRKNALYAHKWESDGAYQRWLQSALDITTYRQQLATIDKSIGLR